MGEIGEIGVDEKREFTHEEVLEALKTIKQVCLVNRRCEGCPLYSLNNRACAVTNIAPNGWNIKSQTFWKVFE